MMIDYQYSRFFLLALALINSLVSGAESIFDATDETNFVCESESFDVTHFTLPQIIDDTTIGAGLPSELKHTFATFVGMQAWIPGLKKYETPLVVRFTHLIDRIDWNCAASYSSNWRDYLTKADPLVRAPQTVSWTDPSMPAASSANVDMHTSDLRLQCMTHAWATVVSDWVPESETSVLSYISDFQITDVTQGYSEKVSACFTDGHADTVCLNEIAEAQCYKPSIIGTIVAHQVAEFARTDGWNMYGELDRDGTPCTANCRRYTDPTGYEPKQTGNSASTHWQPLLETNGCGYETKQQHVTPHIGTLAVPSTMSRTELDERVAPRPKYNYQREANQVIRRMSNLSDRKKMKIEFFDDKLDVIMAVIDKIVKEGATFEQILNFSVGLTGAEYDATILAWKEKVRHDLIRPTTWIKNNMARDTIEVWIPNKGVMPILGKNFEAYVRVMPHSEYVSGSACICQALKDYTDDWLSSTLNKNDSISVETPQFLPGSSRTEPGLVPEMKMKITFADMEDLKDSCGKSRLHGGMHFSASVDNGYELCDGIGQGAAAIANELWSI